MHVHKEGRTIYINLIQKAETVIDNPLLLFGLLFILASINLYFPPLPLESATLFAGYLTGTGRGSAVIIIIATAGGTILSSLLLYLLVKMKGVSFLKTTPLQKYVNSQFYRRSLQWFKKYGLWTVIFGKLVPGMSLGAIISCGILQYDPKKTFLAVSISNLVFFAALTGIGNYLGDYWGNALPWLTKISMITFAAICLLGIIWLVYYLMKRANIKTY